MVGIVAKTIFRLRQEDRIWCYLVSIPLEPDEDTDPYIFEAVPVQYAKRVTNYW
jgi:hypothetical protein